MKLRLSHLEVRPVLVWDIGEELIPGPDLAPAALPLSRLETFTTTLPAEIAALQAKLEARTGD